MQHFLKSLLIGLMAVSFSVQAWDKTDEVTKSDPDTVKVSRLDGGLDLDSVKAIRNDLEDALKKDSKIKTYRLYLTSPGGAVIAATEIARMLGEASDKGLIVETYATGLCASGCTLVLAAGTRGHRTISNWTLFLVHPVQVGGFGGFQCMDHKVIAKTQEEKAINVLMEMLRDVYVKFTGKDKATVEGWLTCGNEQVGMGKLAVDLGMADKVE